MADKQFLTNEAGQRIGVVLDLSTYERLTQQRSADPDILRDLSEPELQALARSTLGFEAQGRLHELLSKQAEASLNSTEVAELAQLSEQVDQLNILKARARYTLKQDISQPE